MISPSSEVSSPESSAREEFNVVSAEDMEVSAVPLLTCDWSVSLASAIVVLGETEVVTVDFDGSSFDVSTDVSVQVEVDCVVLMEDEEMVVEVMLDEASVLLELFIEGFD